MRVPSYSSKRQSGAVAIIVGLTLPVLIGFAGLALDLGHLYVEKTELQNATDACALAASRELTCDPSIGCNPTLLINAENSGLTVASRNNVDFQRNPINNTQISADDIKFSTTFAPNSAYLSRSAGADPASKYVMCSAQQSGIIPWFMQILGAGTQTVTALAVATLSPGQTNCAIPLAICAIPGAAPPTFGLTLGQWYSSKFQAGGGLTGSFNWVDFNPGSTTPPCSGGGASELACLLEGRGACSLPSAGAEVGQTGAINSLSKTWNSRFGLYQSGSTNINTAAPDFTGYSYTPTNWPAQSNALADFLTKRSTHDSYGANVAAGNTLTGLSIGNSYNPTTTPAEHATKGADRRLVITPIVDCAGWAGSQTRPVLSYACVLMLNPFSSPGDDVRLEFLGVSSAIGSPCATSGYVGGPGSVGPFVSALVQ